MLGGYKMLLRHKALNKCFRSAEKFTLEMLVSYCSNVLGEKISKRSIQLDIQYLRDHDAPIIVVERKFYTYENKSYDILKAPLSQKIIDKLVDCQNFTKEINAFSAYRQFADTKQKINTKKTFEKHLQDVGFFINNAFYTKKELRKIMGLIRSHKIMNEEHIAENQSLMNAVFKPKFKDFIKKINSRAFLVDAIFTGIQKPMEYRQLLKLPMKKRQIPQNLTLWGYPVEEKYEKPNKKILYEETFIVQLFLKDVASLSGALSVIPGSHQRELSPLEINLITTNTYPSVCEVNKGGILGYKPMLIQGTETSESPKKKESITLWFSSYHLPIHYVWNNEISL